MTSIFIFLPFLVPFTPPPFIHHSISPTSIRPLATHSIPPPHYPTIPPPHYPTIPPPPNCLNIPGPSSELHSFYFGFFPELASAFPSHCFVYTRETKQRDDDDDDGDDDDDDDVDDDGKGPARTSKGTVTWCGRGAGDQAIIDVGEACSKAVRIV